MDGIRFDALARSLAASGSRRRVVGGFMAAALGLVGLRRAEARACAEVGRVCREHANCCGGLCGPQGTDGRRRCRCRSAEDCPAPVNRCLVATCEADGVCGTRTVICTASDQCHVAGTCDPRTGVCSDPAQPDGTACDDGNACTSGETCQAGACTGGDAVACPPGDTTCDPQTGACTCEAGGRAACGADSSCCNCVSTTGGTLACVAYQIACTSGLCNDFVYCPIGNECPPNHACLVESCSSGPIRMCFPLCGTPFQGTGASVQSLGADADLRVGGAP
ncbi:MAG: hypothetical protein QOF01_4406 [Thermomicrobiales bacterium]|nr:hypothetical protein [Thermomicrobiales bacterium]